MGAERSPPLLPICPGVPTHSHLPPDCPRQPLQTPTVSAPSPGSLWSQGWWQGGDSPAILVVVCHALCSALYVDSLSIFLLTLAANSFCPELSPVVLAPEISSPRKLHEPRQTGVAVMGLLPAGVGRCSQWGKRGVSEGIGGVQAVAVGSVMRQHFHAMRLKRQEDKDPKASEKSDLWGCSDKNRSFEEFLQGKTLLSTDRSSGASG